MNSDPFTTKTRCLREVIRLVEEMKADIGKPSNISYFDLKLKLLNNQLQQQINLENMGTKVVKSEEVEKTYTQEEVNKIVEQNRIDLVLQIREDIGNDTNISYLNSLLK